MAPTPSSRVPHLLLATLLACALASGSHRVASAAPSGRASTPQREAHRNPMARLAVESTVVDPIAGLKLEANTSRIASSGQVVEVRFCCLAFPWVDDFVAIYAPADADPGKTAPVKVRFATEAEGYLATGSGTLRFQLFNHRTSVRIALLRGGWEHPRVVAWGPEVAVENVNEPLQGHLHLTGDNTEMLVQWVTKDQGSPVVKWGLSSGDHKFQASAKTTTYTRNDMCGGHAATVGWIDPGLFHTAVMTGLEPGRRYYYTYGDEVYGFSEESSFLAAPTVGPNTSVNFLAIADLGQAEEDGSTEPWQYRASLNTTRWLTQEVAKKEYQLLVHNGDISYAMGFVPQWDHYFEQMKPIITRVPYMTTPGNHERDWPHSGDRFNTVDDSGGECGVAYDRRCPMPLGPNADAWYSFDFGPIHFLQYSTEHEFKPGSPQYRFIEEDLASIDRSVTPWVIVGGHRPMYISSTYFHWPDGDLEVSAALKVALEPLFYKYKVDLTWHGHHHSYQRTCPVFGDSCLGYREDGTARGPVHMVIGHAGAGLCLDIQPTQAPYFEKVVLDHGYSRVFANGTYLNMEVLYDEDQSLMDTVTLLKPAGWEAAWPAIQDLSTEANAIQVEAETLLSAAFEV